MGDLIVRGQWGIGDNLHSRAVLRELMKSNTVWLESAYTSVFHDLAALGLKLVLRRQWKPRIADAGFASYALPARGEKRQITYDRKGILEHGSILAAQFASVGLQMPERSDFSIPVPGSWRERARRLIGEWSTGGRPICLYRPIVLNKGWLCIDRAPDPQGYAAVFAPLLDRFFTVSVASLKPGCEWIHGPVQKTHVAIHNGELDFETLTGLFAEADVVFGNPGFFPVLAQSVGKRNVVVYGGNENFRTTNSAGAHLAPTLAIEPDPSCECHSRLERCRNECTKRIDVTSAIERMGAFLGAPIAPALESPRSRVLVFGTTWVDSPHRAGLFERWLELHGRLNADCDLLIVDSASPWPDMRSKLNGHAFYSFHENIGHLSRGGRDGWGRAFCRGLQTAIDGGYDYVVHIEGDSLFRRPVMPIIEDMARRGIDVASVPVVGTRRREVGWVETGLMFFSVKYLAESRLIERYDWPTRRESPTPEVVLRRILGDRLVMMPWRAMRADKGDITVENVLSLDLDWLTHCWSDETLKIYDRWLGTI